MHERYLCQLNPNDPCTHRQHICIIVLSGQPGHRRIRAQSAADSFHFVGSHGNTDSRTAHDDTSVCFAGYNHIRCLHRNIRIIHSLRTVTAAVCYDMPSDSSIFLISSLYSNAP